MVHESDAISAVRMEVDNYLSGTTAQLPSDVKYDVYVVMCSYVLGNEKYLISTTLLDGRYYEVTYNKQKHEMYVDTYVKVNNTLRKDVH